MAKLSLVLLNIDGTLWIMAMFSMKRKTPSSFLSTENRKWCQMIQTNLSAATPTFCQHSDVVLMTYISVVIAIQPLTLTPDFRIGTIKRETTSMQRVRKQHACSLEQKMAKNSKLKKLKCSKLYTEPWFPYHS